MAVPAAPAKTAAAKNDAVATATAGAEEARRLRPREVDTGSTSSASTVAGLRAASPLILAECIDL